MNNQETEQLAADLEQFMFERGEYDYGVGDRVRWVEDADVPEPYALAESKEVLDNAREKVTGLIEQVIKGEASEEIGGIEPIRNYLNDELNTMDEEDELIPAAEKLLSKLKEIDDREIE